jgi:hypothetical protein
MRQMISGLVAALAVVVAGSAPAKACGFTPCEQTYVPTTSYSGCATGCNTGSDYERLAEPTTQYYYVNQGPTYTGPGAFAPYPTYQEGEVSSSTGDHIRPYHYGTNGGHYATAATPYYEGSGVEGPAVYSYRWHRHHPHYTYRYGHTPRVHHGMRYGYHMPRHYYSGHPVLRRYY